MTTPACQRERERLAKALKALRTGAGLSGARLAGMLGWQQSKVSNIETRKQLASEDDIAAWAGAAGATPETASDLLAMLRDARVEYAAGLSFERDIRPMFREKDRDSMLRAFDLWSHSDVHAQQARSSSASITARCPATGHGRRRTSPSSSAGSPPGRRPERSAACQLTVARRSG
jgi:transcriptional regulator with XRE-family HTH domain